ncbi:hypothetical protein [Clostridium sp. AM58-1XD]|uniref:hypothetical protein n=1 Tax=Clostridium sp. AM58-1XD TaxID=2292307 RepID=UPI000E4F457D|nr:hypothetical protein [Clostridium sp. AM58-1XD]RGY98081.1 hypothetical protein DXA13_12340 [Clostridium sp. AM58-1XD]
MIGSFTEIVYAIGTLAFGTLVLTIGLAGYFGTTLNKAERVICVICGIFICLPESLTDIAGYAGAVIILAEIIIRGRVAKKRVQAA